MTRRPEPLVAVMTTVPSAADADAIAAALVQARLAACVQIETIESVYRWQGAIEHQREWRLVAKTVRSRLEAVEAAISDRHPYELPAIWAVDVIAASAPYAQWVAAGSSPGETVSGR